MSASLRLDAEQLRQLATALEQLTKITEETGIRFTSYAEMSAEVGDNNIRIGYDGQRYVVDDRTGD